MIVRNSITPQGRDIGPATPSVDEGTYGGGTFVSAVEEAPPDPSVIRRREQWKAAQQRRRDRLAERSSDVT